MDINNAEKEVLFNALFAENGTRQPISIEDWKNGWFSITGENNGIPTSKQFNTLQNISDLKCYLLYTQVLSLEKQLAELRDKVESGEIGTVDVGGFVYVGSIDTKTNKKDVIFVVDGGDETAGGLLFAGATTGGIEAGDILLVVSGLTTGEKGAMVYVGSADKSVRLNSILFITSGEENTVMKYAAFTNMTIGPAEPSVPNWGFVNGKLTVAQNPDPDTKFFARL